MKKFVATFQKKSGGKLYLPLHADDIETAKLYAQTIENTSADFWGSKGFKLVEVKEVSDEPAK